MWPTDITFNGSETVGLSIRQKCYSYLLDQREKALVSAKDVTFNGLQTHGLSISQKCYLPDHKRKKIAVYYPQVLRSGSERILLGNQPKMLHQWSDRESLNITQRCYLLYQKEKIAGVLSTGVTLWIRERILLGNQPKMLHQWSDRESLNITQRCYTFCIRKRRLLGYYQQVLPSGSERGYCSGISQRCYLQ